MGWKEWPSWLRYGIIFLIFPLIGSFCVLRCEFLSCLVCAPFAFPMMLAIEEPGLWWMHLANFIVYFAIGAAIGWIRWYHSFVKDSDKTKKEKIRQGVILIGVLSYPFLMFLWSPLFESLKILPSYCPIGVSEVMCVFLGIGPTFLFHMLLVAMFAYFLRNKE